MILEQQEYQTIRDIILEYKSIDDELTNIQDRLAILEKEKTEALETIQSIKDRETNFFNELEKKYGKGKFDVFSGEYILNHDNR